MARSVPLSTLITRVRRRADIESATARFPDAEITDNLNESITELYDIIRMSWGDGYFRSSYVFTTSTAVDTYALPSDFLDLVSVDVQVSASDVVSARRFMESERNAAKSPLVGWLYGQPVFYQLQGNNIKFIPQPSAAYLVTINYVPTPTKLVGSSDTIDGVAGWEEYAVLDAAIKCLIKDESFEHIAILENRKAVIKGRIDALAPQRDGQPERVQDVVGWGVEL